MKKPVINYVLESKDKNPNNRTDEELIIAIVHAGFVSQIDDKIKHERFKISLKCKIKPRNFGLSKDNYRNGWAPNSFVVWWPGNGYTG